MTTALSVTSQPFFKQYSNHLLLILMSDQLILPSLNPKTSGRWKLPMGRYCVYDFSAPKMQDCAKRATAVVCRHAWHPWLKRLNKSNSLLPIRRQPIIQARRGSPKCLNNWESKIFEFAKLVTFSTSGWKVCHISDYHWDFWVTILCFTITWQTAKAAGFLHSTLKRAICFLT